MKTILTALTIVATMFSSSAFAADSAQLQKLLDTNKCKLCDLSGAGLREADLGGTDLTNANLRYAYMNGAKLCNTPYLTVQ